jgi:hypothetical protein
VLALLERIRRLEAGLRSLEARGQT